MYSMSRDSSESDISRNADQSDNEAPEAGASHWPETTGALPRAASSFRLSKSHFARGATPKLEGEPLAFGQPSMEV
jgi:hypothetical protein